MSRSYGGGGGMRGGAYSGGGYRSFSPGARYGRGIGGTW
jgi:hypothetical protein